MAHLGHQLQQQPHRRHVVAARRVVQRVHARLEAPGVRHARVVQLLLPAVHACGGMRTRGQAEQASQPPQPALVELIVVHKACPAPGLQVAAPATELQSSCCPQAHAFDPQEKCCGPAPGLQVAAAAWQCASTAGQCASTPMLHDAASAGASGVASPPETNQATLQRCSRGTRPPRPHPTHLCRSESMFLQKERLSATNCSSTPAPTLPARRHARDTSQGQGSVATGAVASAPP